MSSEKAPTNTSGQFGLAIIILYYSTTKKNNKFILVSFCRMLIIYVLSYYVCL